MSILLFILGIAFGLVSILLFKNKKQTSASFATLFMVVCIATAYLYRPNTQWEEQEIETIRIHGSKTLGRSLMPKLVEKFFEINGYDIIKREHHQDVLQLVGSHPNKKKSLAIEIVAKGSLYGFKQLASNHCEISMASSRIKTAETERMGFQFALEKHEHIIAYDAVRLIVHPALGKKLKYIQEANLSKILTGKIKAWQEINHELNGNINCYVRDNQSGTFQYLENLFLQKAPLRKDARQLAYFEQIARAVAKDSLSLGFVNYALNPQLLADVQVLEIKNLQGVLSNPSSLDIHNKKYPLSRPLYLYNNKMTDQRPVVQSFIDFCKNSEANDIVFAEGLIP